MNKKLTPSEALEDILDIHMHHTEYDDEDPDYPIQWDQDDGSIAENYPNEAKILREALRPKDSGDYLDLYNRALAEEYKDLEEATENVRRTEDGYNRESLCYYIDAHEHDADFFDQVRALSIPGKLIVFECSLSNFKRPWLKGLLEEVKNSEKSYHSWRAQAMYDYYYGKDKQ